jgi:hypothetical protein
VQPLLEAAARLQTKKEVALYEAPFFFAVGLCNDASAHGVRRKESCVWQRSMKELADVLPKPDP